jgi:hypothetical protein
LPVNAIVAEFVSTIVADTVGLSLVINAEKLHVEEPIKVSPEYV